MDMIESANTIFIKSILTQQNFFSYETKNATFFQTSQSDYLNQYYQLRDSAVQLMLLIDPAYPEFKLADQVDTLKVEFTKIDALFKDLVTKVKERGYKDYSLEGSMRADVHWLEDIAEISTEKILSLRRHEKDYIIRNELSYAKKLNTLANILKTDIATKRQISSIRKDTILKYLNNYQSKFNQLVELDQESGIKDNSALKLRLDQQINALEARFDELTNQAHQKQQQLFFQLNLLFGILLSALILGSIILSAFIAKRITSPLRELTVYITRFVDSNFTLTTTNPIIRSKDEIGKLTQNFTVLKEEIISQLRFFKQKVDERTAELAAANQQLVQLNEANSRFVPNEFLQYLGKSTIEEVKLGDHTEGEMTIMFTDIRSFTKISEKLSPQDNFDFINNYLKNIVPVIRAHNGIIDKYIGDSIMALFPDGAYSALQAAYGFEIALSRFNQLQVDKGLEPIRIGVGIHTGRVILGTVGHDQRLETTVISDTVNIASRVEGLTKLYGAKIIATKEILEQLPVNHTFNYRLLGQVYVMGKSQIITVYEFLSENDKMKLSYQKDYEKGLALFNDGRYAEAKIIFTALFQKNPSDKALELIMEKIVE